MVLDGADTDYFISKFTTLQGMQLVSDTVKCMQCFLLLFGVFWSGLLLCSAFVYFFMSPFYD